MSSGTACALYLGAPGFCRPEQRPSAVCRGFTQFLIKVPEDTPRVLYSPHCQFLFTNHHAAAIYFLTVPLTHNSGRVTQICVFNTVKLGTSASSP